MKYLYFVSALISLWFVFFIGQSCRDSQLKETEQEMRALQELATQSGLDAELSYSPKLIIAKIEEQEPNSTTSEYQGQNTMILFWILLKEKYPLHEGSIICTYKTPKYYAFINDDPIKLQSSLGSKLQERVRFLYASYFLLDVDKEGTAKAVTELGLDVTRKVIASGYKDAQVYIDIDNHRINIFMPDEIDNPAVAQARADEVRFNEQQKYLPGSARQEYNGPDSWDLPDTIPAYSPYDADRVAGMVAQYLPSNMEVFVFMSDWEHNTSHSYERKMQGRWWGL